MEAVRNRTKRNIRQCTGNDVSTGNYGSSINLYFRYSVVIMDVGFVVPCASDGHSIDVFAMHGRVSPTRKFCVIQNRSIAVNLEINVRSKTAARLNVYIACVSVLIRSNGPDGIFPYLIAIGSGRIEFLVSIQTQGECNSSKVSLNGIFPVNLARAICWNSAKSDLFESTVFGAVEFNPCAFRKHRIEFRDICIVPAAVESPRAVVLDHVNHDSDAGNTGF